MTELELPPSSGVRHKRWIYPGIWMVVITLASTDYGSASHTLRILVSITHWLGFDLSVPVLNKLHWGIRKMAHITEYTILGYLLFQAMVDQNRPVKKSTVGCLLLIVLVYACLDEFHQSFVPSRTPAITDVLFDISGGVIGLLVAAISI